jgi:hypothetical protein
VPKRSPQQRTGFSAEAFVGKAVSDAGHVWNDTRRDFGIDGHIEFVDAATQVSGHAVAAQVKGTAVGFHGETQAGFRFTCEADHIDYWLRYGRPVVLICVNVRDQRSWWKRLDTWFAEPVRRARRVVDFDKAADVFDVSAFSLLSTIAVPVGEAMPRLEGSEQLVSNLLTVTGFASRIWSASTPCRDRADAWERMRSDSAFEGGFLLSGGRIHTLASLEDGPLAVLRDGPVTSAPTQDWAYSEDEDVQRRFTALLNFTLFGTAGHERPDVPGTGRSQKCPADLPLRAAPAASIITR